MVIKENLNVTCDFIGRRAVFPASYIFINMRVCQSIAIKVRLSKRSDLFLILRLKRVVHNANNHYDVIWVKLFTVNLNDYDR